MNFAVIETGGKQYKVSESDKLKIEKIKIPDDKGIIFDKVLLVSETNGVQIGAPYVSGAKIEAKMIKEGRDKKKIVFRYHSKTRYRKKKGHRQSYVEVKILRI